MDEPTTTIRPSRTASASACRLSVARDDRPAAQDKIRGITFRSGGIGAQQRRWSEQQKAEANQ